MSYGGGNRLHAMDEERARNELLFTEERFRQLAVVAAEQEASALQRSRRTAFTDRSLAHIVHANERATPEEQEEENAARFARADAREAGRRAALQHVAAHAQSVRREGSTRERETRPRTPAVDTAPVAGLAGGPDNDTAPLAPRAEAVFASAEAAIGRAEEALSASERPAQPPLVHWAPHARDWARFAASASDFGNAGRGNVSQHGRDCALEHTFADVLQSDGGNLHDTCNSGTLRDLVVPTLEWRVAWARHRSVVPLSQPMGAQWYRAIAVLAARYPAPYRISYPYRGQRAAPGEYEILWIEHLLQPARNFDPPGDRGREAQQRRSMEVKHLLCDFDGTGAFTSVGVRNRIRGLVRDTIVNLNPGAQEWPDAVWAHALKCCRAWDEECLTMPTAQDLAVLLMSGVQDAAIEAHANFLEVADRPHTTGELLDAERAHERAERAATEARAAGEASFAWPELEDELEEQLAAAAACERAMRTRSTAEQEAEGFATRAAQVARRQLGSRRGDRAFGLTQTRLVMTRDVHGLHQSFTTVIVPTLHPAPCNAQQLDAKASITKAREELEAQVERDEITEGAYLQRMNALRDAYNRV